MYLRAIFQVQAPGGLIFAYLTEGFLLSQFGGLILNIGAYTWRALFSEFYGIYKKEKLLGY